MSSETLWTFAALGFVALVVFTMLFLASRYRRCPSDAVLVIYGKVGTGQSSRCIHGGGALVWPLVQDYRYLRLTPHTINIDLKNALSLQNIRINVPSTFTVGVSTVPAIMNNAAERLLNLESGQIEDMAREIIFGQLRLTVASLTIEQINQDRESFLEAIRKNVEPELNKIGLYLINVNITDITDESDYIHSIGMKASSEAINRAKIDVAQQEKVGAVGESEAQREQTIEVAKNKAQAAKGQKAAESDQRIYTHAREEEAVTGENKAKAGIVRSNADLAIEQQQARQRAEVALRDADIEIQRAEARAAHERLMAQIVIPAEIARKQVEINALAAAEQVRLQARGDADATLAKYNAEAEGMMKLLASKAKGYEALVDACGSDARAAASLLMIEKIEEMVKMQVEAIKNLKIDKVTVWDSGGGTGSSTTANFASSLIKSLPPLHDVARMAGIELPEYLGQATANAPARPTTGQKGPATT